MAGYKLSAAILNRKRAPGKVSDGLALSFIRNKDGTLTAWQRVKGQDIKVAHISGEISQDLLTKIRADAYAVKIDSGSSSPSAMTFAEAWEYFREQMTSAANSKWSPKTLSQATARMSNHIEPTSIWSMPVTGITAADIRAALEKLRREQPKLAPKVLMLIGQTLAAVTSKAGLSSNQARLLKSELKAIEHKVSFNKLPAITDISGIGKLLQAIENSSLYLTTRVALLLQAYTVQRSGEVAGARRQEFLFMDDGRVTWTIPRRRMKISSWEKKPYDQVLVLPAAVGKLIRRLPDDTDYLFVPRHGEADHLTVEAFSGAFQRLGFRGVAVPHGWRSSLKTMAEDAIGDDDRPLFSSSWIEGVLDHSPPGISAHYQRSKTERGMERVLAWWADLLEAAKQSR
jgi:integrase